MKRSECDYCRKLESSEEVYGNSPRHWISVQGGSSAQRYERPRDFCSRECAIAYLETTKAQPEPALA